MNDQKIIELFWQRKECAISEASSKYGNYCYTIAWNVLSNHEDSEECVNDTWFAAWKRMPPKRPSRLSVFLGKITRDFAIDKIRKKCASKRMDSHIVDLSEEVESLNTRFSYTLEEQMDHRELVQLLNHFLTKLPAKDRDIFVRRYWYMDSINAIAKRHNCSESSIKSNLYRNRRKLERKIKEVAANEG